MIIASREKYKGYRGSRNKGGGWNKRTMKGMWTKLIISRETVDPQKNIINSTTRDIRARVVARVEDDVDVWCQMMTTLVKLRDEVHEENGILPVELLHPETIPRAQINKPFLKQ
jgi:hypothetical protein